MNKPIAFFTLTSALALLWMLSWIFGWPYSIASSLSIAIVVASAMLYVFFKKQDSDNTSKSFRLKKTTFSGSPGEKQSLGHFEKAINFLKKHKIPQTPSRTFSNIPWYIVLGEEGVGRETVLQNAGFENLYESSLFTALKTKKPSFLNAPVTYLKNKQKNCQIWLSPSAVFFCPPPSWQQNSNHWHTFCHSLKKNHGKRQLKGVISVVDAQDFLNGSTSIKREGKNNDKVFHQTKKIVTETFTILQTLFPTYILFTKTDLISGFEETFEYLSHEERKLPWGFMLGFRTSTLANVESLHQKLKAIDSELIHHVGWRLDSKNSFKKQKAFFLFPRLLRKLRLKIAPLLSSLIETSSENAPLQLRGVYWSACPQRQTLSIPLSSSNDQEEKTSAFAIAQPNNKTSAPFAQNKQGYFSSGFIHQVLSEDQNLSIAAHRISGTAFTGTNIMAGAVILFFSGFLFLSGIAWNRNSELIQNIQMHSLPYLSPEFGNANPAFDHLSKTPSSLKPLKMLISMKKNGIPFLWDLGLYKGEDLLPALSRNFLQVYKIRFVHPLIETLTSKTEKPITDQDSATQDSESQKSELLNKIDVFQKYQWLTYPRPHKKAFTALSETKLLTTTLSRDLFGSISSPVSHLHPKSTEWVSEHIAQYFAISALFPHWAAQKNADWVSHIQKQYWKLLENGLWVHLLQMKTPVSSRFIQIQEIIGQTKSIVTTDFTLPKIFTAIGWKKHIQPHLLIWPEKMLGPFWMWSESNHFNHQNEALKTEKLHKLQSLYFEAFKNSWTYWLSSIEIQLPNEHITSLETLQTLLGQETSVWEKLFRFIEDNTSLNVNSNFSFKSSTKKSEQNDLKESSETGSTGDKPTETNPSQVFKTIPASVKHQIDELVQYFEPLLSMSTSSDKTSNSQQQTKQNTPSANSLALYLQELHKLKGALQNFEQAQNQKALIEEIQNIRGNIRGLIDEQSPQWSPILERLLWPPIEIASQHHNQHTSHLIAEAWCDNIFKPYDSNFTNRFPFHQKTWQQETSTKNINPTNAWNFQTKKPSTYEEASLKDFSDFFHPQSGSLWKFFRNSLSSQIEKNETGFSFKENLGKNLSIYYTKNLLSFFEHAEQITETFFTANNSSPHFDFQIKIHPVSQVSATSISVGNQKATYRNGSERWQTLTWPGDEPERGAAIELVGLPGSQETLQEVGPWGLFSILEQAETVQYDRNKKTFSLAWKLIGYSQPLMIDFKFEDIPIPFDSVTNTSAFKQVIRSILASPNLSPPEKLVPSQNASCTKSRADASFK